MNCCSKESILDLRIMIKAILKKIEDAIGEESLRNTVKSLAQYLIMTGESIKHYNDVQKAYSLFEQATMEMSYIRCLVAVQFKSNLDLRKAVVDLVNTMPMTSLDKVALKRKWFGYLKDEEFEKLLSEIFVYGGLDEEEEGEKSEDESDLIEDDE